MSDFRTYVGMGLFVGLLAGLIEATVVHRPGPIFVPYAALAYGVLGGAAFLLLFLLARLIRRNLLRLGIGASLAFFFALEVAFWANRSSALAVEAVSSRVINLAIAVGGLVLGALGAIFLGRRLAKISLWRPALVGAAIAAASLALYFGFSYFASAPGLNCILVSLDAQRADHLACYGYHRETSPNIDRLADEGMLFTRAFTSSPGSTGGHSSMLTGLYPQTNGAYWWNAMVLDGANVTAAELFGKNGYSTAAFIDNWLISPRFGFGQGFECFVDGGNSFVLKKATPPMLNRGLALVQTVRRVVKKHGYPSKLDIVDALRWIRWRKNDRFFVFLHIMDPHVPYFAPDGFLGRYEGEGADLSAAHIWDLHARAGKRKQLTREEKRFLVNRYDEDVCFADHKIGMLRAELARLGLLDRTLIVLLADHAEVMDEGRERLFWHETLDYGCLHIPLIFSLPGTVPEGKRMDLPAGSVDVLPTIVEILGLEDTAKRQGISLVSQRLDKRARNRPIFSFGDATRKESCVVTDRWQLKMSDGETYLYSLENDPFGSPNVLEESRSVADSLGSVLEDWLVKCLNEAVVAFGPEGKAVKPGEADLERLRALGYVQ